MEIILVSSLSCFCFLFLILTLAEQSPNPLFTERKQEEDIKRSHFPDGFLFGTATSAYQIEGAYLEDGKSINNWDFFCTKQGSIENGANGYVADDHYHRFLEDIEIIHSLGVNAYRFSISWTRVLPRGRNGEVNPKGIEFYNKIIDNLLLRDIQPFVTIHHHDHPQEFEDRFGGWLSYLMQEELVHFAEICFKSFGDRVKYWATINEPNLFSEMAYEKGIYPPARCSPPFGNCYTGNSDVEPLVAMHNMLLAHAKVAKLYRDHYQPKQGGMIGIVVHMFMYEPFSDHMLDKEAAERALAFNSAWVLDPLVLGDYHPDIRRYHGTELPRFTREEKSYLKDSIDFIGMNHYGTLYAKDCLYSSCKCSGAGCVVGSDRAIRGYVYTTGERDGVLIGDQTGMSRFFVVPRGMEEIINYAKNRYHNKPIFVTENGYSPIKQENTGSDGLLEDVKRIEYHKAYLAFLAKAIRGGADVRGYFVWTLMDDFEWSNGFGQIFGLHYIDRQMKLNRIPRLSAMWYKNFLNNASLVQQE